MVTFTELAYHGPGWTTDVDTAHGYVNVIVWAPCPALPSSERPARFEWQGCWTRAVGDGDDFDDVDGNFVHAETLGALLDSLRESLRPARDHVDVPAIMDALAKVAHD
jgi:hypothetical protein